MADLGPVSLNGMNPTDGERVEREGRDLGRILQQALQGDFEVTGEEATSFIRAVGNRFTPQIRDALYGRIIAADGRNAFNLSPEAITRLRAAQIAANGDSARAALEQSDDMRRAAYVMQPNVMRQVNNTTMGDGRLAMQETSGDNRIITTVSVASAIGANFIPLPKWIKGGWRVAAAIARPFVGYAAGNFVASSANALDLIPPQASLAVGATPPDPRLNNR